MGLLVNGVWQDKWYDTETSGGRFVRTETAFRGGIDLPLQPGRYHLFVSLACPWAHRTLIFRKLKKLEDSISVSVVDPLMKEEGWTFGGTPDPVAGADRLYEVYRRAKPDYTGRVTVPVLWDKQNQTIVNNESAEIIRLFNGASTGSGDFYPEPLRAEIDQINAFVYESINNGVYRAGFATTQEAYEEGFQKLFAALDEIESLLGQQAYLVGDRLTEADWRLFTSLVRFDAVYFGHFKCNLRRIADYPNLSNYVRALYQIDGIAETVNIDHIKRHYYGSHTNINPTGIVPLGPELDFEAPHNRG